MAALTKIEGIGEKYAEKLIKAGFEKIEDLIKFPMGKVDRQIANDLIMASSG